MWSCYVRMTLEVDVVFSDMGRCKKKPDIHVFGCCFGLLASAKDQGV